MKEQKWRVNIQHNVNQFDWYYRYSVLGSREQKSLYYSPGGDSICGEFYNHHSWTNYMLGAGGEQLAVYKGVQAAHEDSSGNMGRRVYMYNESYISLGGTLVTLPDNTKQFNAMDNIRSVRLTVSVNGDSLRMQCFDYKPFGDTLNAEDESRIGYASQERDEESRYFAMGARQYDPLAGRFLSVDPLYESFPDKTPYHYCNNNPISFRDPSGLSPEGEKGKEDEVQVVYIVLQEVSLVEGNINDYVDGYMRALKYMTYMQVMRYWMQRMSFDVKIIDNDDGSGGGSGGGGGRVSGTKTMTFSFKGISLSGTYNAEILSKNGVTEAQQAKFIVTQIVVTLAKMNSTETGQWELSNLDHLNFDFSYSKAYLTNEWNNHYANNKVDELLGLTFSSWASVVEKEFKKTYTGGWNLPNTSDIIYLAYELLFSDNTLNKLLFQDTFKSNDTFDSMGEEYEFYGEHVSLFNSNLSQYSTNVSLFYVMSHEISHKYDATLIGLPKNFDKEGSAFESADNIMRQYMEISGFMRGYRFYGYHEYKK